MNLDYFKKLLVYFKIPFWDKCKEEFVNTRIWNPYFDNRIDTKISQITYEAPIQKPSLQQVIIPFEQTLKFEWNYVEHFTNEQGELTIDLNTKPTFQQVTGTIETENIETGTIEIKETILNSNYLVSYVEDKIEIDFTFPTKGNMRVLYMPSTVNT